MSDWQEAADRARRINDLMRFYEVIAGLEDPEHPHIPDSLSGIEPWSERTQDMAATQKTADAPIAGGRVTRCECGKPLQAASTGGWSAQEVGHFVWSLRRDGTMSNLGFCPEKRGFTEAIRKAQADSPISAALYHGKVIR